jgi:subtilase family serine protease
VISQSFGATENTFPGFATGDYSSILDLRYAFEDAQLHRVTVLAAFGDEGATNAELTGSSPARRSSSAWRTSSVTTAARRISR